MPTARTIRVRMYRPGFGDCFLITFFKGRVARHILIDCGVWQGADLKNMDKIVADIEKTTKGSLAALVASHAHQDHVSGYLRYANRFRKMEIGKVWLPWTENPADEEANKLRKRRSAAVAESRRGMRRMGLTRLEGAAEFALSNVVGSDNGGPDEDMSLLTGGFGDNKRVRYWHGGQTLRNAGGIEGLDVDFFGPPKDTALLGRMNPPPTQRYVAGAEAVQGGSDTYKAFPALKDQATEECPLEQSPLDYYLAEVADFSTSMPEGLALQLDNVLNNTSLVILFRYRGKTLLFPGDAQYGNWFSWMNGDQAKEVFEGLDFLKIAHHASANATPKHVVESLKKGRTAAMVPTQEKVYNGIPRDPLLAQLGKTCAAVVRSDQVVIKGAPAGPKTALPKGFSKTDLWIDYLI